VHAAEFRTWAENSYAYPKLVPAPTRARPAQDRTELGLTQQAPKSLRAPLQRWDAIIARSVLVTLTAGALTAGAAGPAEIRRIGAVTAGLSLL
jgi:hypothetical protein